MGTHDRREGSKLNLFVNNVSVVAPKTLDVEYVCVLQVMYLQRGELNRETVYPMHPSSIHGVEDMSTLAELHEAAIMHNLFLRYQNDSIYVRV